MLRHKSELEKLNYYSWARFLEQVNDDNALIRVIDKLELATPREKIFLFIERFSGESLKKTHAFIVAKNFKK